MTTYNPAALPELVALLEEMAHAWEKGEISWTVWDFDAPHPGVDWTGRALAALALARQPVAPDQYTTGLELAAQGMSEVALGMSEIATTLTQETEQARERIAELEANRNYISSCLEHERQDKDRYAHAYALLQVRVRDLHTLGRELLSKYREQMALVCEEQAAETWTCMAELDAEIAAYRARLDG